MKYANATDYEIAREFPPEWTEPRYEISDIFHRYGKEYRQNHHLSWLYLAVMQAIENCRTTALGGHVDQCDSCGHIEISYNSCRNRHCPKCRASQRSAWVDARQLELLPIQYFHIVFTLPQELVPLARYNQATIYDLLFRTAADTLQTFAQNRWQAKLGITMVLHTWGQTLNEHPHVHCIVTGGGIKNDDCSFVRAPKNFLFPVKALSPVFRQKYLEALVKARKKGEFGFIGQPELATQEGWNKLLYSLRQHNWVVYAKQPFDSPEYLIRYLGRYINRIAIANHRIQNIDNGTITFNYFDNRDDQQKSMELSADCFISRFLKHVLPRQFRRIRYYGFMVNSLRKAKLTLCRKLLGMVNPDRPYIPDIDAWLTSQGSDPTLCPECGMGQMHNVFHIFSFTDPPEYFLEAAKS